jgi:hypothetical protein
LTRPGSRSEMLAHFNREVRRVFSPPVCDGKQELQQALLDVKGGDLFHRLHVLDDLLADAGPLHLDRHLPPVPERRPVHLAERCRGQRCRVEE